MPFESFSTSSSQIFAYAKFDLEALCSRATTLRQGVSCIGDPNQHPASGSFNWTIFVSFEDGVRWIFRSPHSKQFQPAEIGRKILASEAATLRYLRAYSDIPVPEVYDYCASGDNRIGIPFILMSEAPGRPLSKIWRPAGSPQSDPDSLSKAKVVSQLGRITCKLAQLRFDKIGSLFEENGSFVMNECLSRGHILHERYSLGIPRGPFISQAEFYDSLVYAFYEHAGTLPLSHHCFIAPVPSQSDYSSHTQYESAVDLWNDFVTIGCKIDSAENRLDYMIAGDTLRDVVRNLNISGIKPGSFPLCHPDLSVNNIFVDDDFNISCIIDWAFASSIPESMLLAPPGLPQYGDELTLDLQISFMDGFIAAAPQLTEGSVYKYRELLEQGHFSWRLSRLLNLDSTDDYNLFATLWAVFNNDQQNPSQHFFSQRPSPQYAQLYEELQEEDQPLSKIEKDENESFRNRDFRKTIARKLTLVSGWKEQYNSSQSSRLRQDGNVFVTSPNLWKWIHSFIEDWEDIS